jgi:hypothetical protein
MKNIRVRSWCRAAGGMKTGTPILTSSIALLAAALMTAGTTARSSDTTAALKSAY